MANTTSADGSVLIAVNMDTANADKELAKLRKKIQNNENTLQETTRARDEAYQKSLFDGAALDAEKAKLEDMKQDLREMRELAKDKTLSVSTREEAKQSIPQQELFIREQQERVRMLQTEWNKTNNAVDRYDAKIESTTRTLAEQTSEAGELQKQVDNAARNSSRMGDALKGADDRMKQFTKRFAGLARRALVFSVITKALTSFRSWMGDIIMQNEEARKAIAKLKGALLTLAQPLIEVIIPAFVSLVNVLTHVVTAVANLIAKLFGTTAENAANSAENLYNESDAIKGVGGAAKAASKQLASFDEINQLTGSFAEAASSGLGSIVPDFSGIKNGTDGLDSKLDDILKIAGDIGLALLGWKIASTLIPSLDNLSGLLGAISIAAGVPLVIDAITDVSTTGDITWENVIKGTAGGTMIGGGLGTVLATALDGEWIKGKGGKLGFISGMAALAAGTVLSIESTISTASKGITWQNLLSGAAGGAMGGFGLGQVLASALGGKWDTVSTKLGLAAIGAGTELLINSVVSSVNEGITWKSILTGAAGGLQQGFGLAQVLKNVLPEGTKFNTSRLAFTGILVGAGINLLADGISGLLKEGVTAENALKTALGLSLSAAGIGFQFGGITGGVIGLTVGVAVSFLMWKANDINENDTFRKMAQGTLEMPDTKNLSQKTDEQWNSLRANIPALSRTQNAEDVKIAESNGFNVQQGYSDGVVESAKKNEPRLNSAVQAVGRMTAKVYDINSPSRLMYDYGLYIDQGLANGITDNMGLATAVVKSMGDTVKALFVGIWTSVATSANSYWTSALERINELKAALRSIERDIKINISVNSPKVSTSILGGARSLPLPRLASGAVIPPNREFMAVLGDQKHGTNVEAPLSTIEQAVENVLNRRGTGGNGSTTVILELDRQQFAKAVFDANQRESKRIGVNLAGNQR